MERGDPSGQEHENNEKRRRSQSKFNKDLPRYECFCAKQYLSYPALYLHMKNKHNDYFQNTKNGKKVEPTKLIQSYNHTEGYKVYKIAVDSSLLDMDKKEIFSGKYYDQNFIENSKGNIFMNPNGSYIGYSNLPYSHNYGYMMPENQANGEQKKPAQREAVIEVALSMFIQTLSERPAKQRYQTELLFLLLVDCLNKNYERLKDARTESKEVHRYTAEYNSEKIHVILPFFEAEYLPSLAESKPHAFFIKHSHLISSGQFKVVIEQFYNYVYSKKSQPSAIMPPEPQLSENEMPSDDQQDNDEPEEDDDDVQNEEQIGGEQS